MDMTDRVVLYWENEFRIEAAGGKQGVGKQAAFEDGEEIFVVLKSEKATGRATHLEALGGGRHKVAYHEKMQPDEDRGERVSKIFDVRSARVIHVVDRSIPCVIVCGPTQDFRYLCRTQVTPQDTVLEIGCSYGKASRVLAEQLGLHPGGGVKLQGSSGGNRLICVDISADGIAASKLHNADSVNTRFVEMNVIDHTGDRLLSLYLEGQDNIKACSLPSLVFLDIGGNREAEDVRALVPIIQRVLHPRQIIIKSEQVFGLLKRQRWGKEAGIGGRGIDVFESNFFSTPATRCVDDEDSSDEDEETLDVHARGQTQEWENS